MLLKFGARNCYSFKEGIEISFKLEKNGPGKISKGRKVASLLCIKGANGSGKTNALKIISFMRLFCLDSSSGELEDEIPIETFFLNEDPVDMFFEMEINGVEYRYELSVTANKVLSEKLSRKVHNFITVFAREENKLTSCIKEFSDLKAIKLRPNASIISTAYQYEAKSTKPIYDFITNIKSNVGWQGILDVSSDPEVVSEISEYYLSDSTLLEFVIDVIKKFDLGIENISIEKDKDEIGETFYYPLFTHKANIENNKLLFPYQSSGTKALFLNLYLYYDNFYSGGILVMDEFDIIFHPHILQHLLGMFDDEELNPNNAQMIFSTHNTDIMEYMSKYRTVLINQENSESYGYRLDEIPVI
jgi:AAA15 family ATPase/GTPase